MGDYFRWAFFFFISKLDGEGERELQGKVFLGFDRVVGSFTWVACCYFDVLLCSRQMSSIHIHM